MTPSAGPCMAAEARFAVYSRSSSADSGVNLAGVNSDEAQGLHRDIDRQLSDRLAKPRSCSGGAPAGDSRLVDQSREFRAVCFTVRC